MDCMDGAHTNMCTAACMPHAAQQKIPADVACAPPFYATPQVSWSGVPNPTIADVIAYYVVAPNTTVDTLSPLKFNWVNKSPTYLQGSGSLV